MPSDVPEIHPIVQIAGTGGWRLALPHTREDGLLVWVARGHGHVMLDGLRHGLSPHTAVFVPAGTLVALDGAAQLYGVAVLFPPAAEIVLPDAARRLRMPSVQAQSEFVALTAAMTQEQSSARDFHGAASRAHATLIAIWLRRGILDTPPAAALRADQRLAQAFARLVARDYRSGRTMAGYAEQLGVTAEHLSRACKRATGQTAARILTGRVLHAARLLLADTSHPIGHVANHLGFRSAAYFTRFIQNQTGQTPSRLRANAAMQHKKPS